MNSPIRSSGFSIHYAWSLALLIAQEGDVISTEKKKSVSSGVLSKSNQFWPRLRKILQIVFPSIISKEFGHLTAYTALLLVRIWLTIRIAELTGSLGKLVGARDWEHIFKLQGWFWGGFPFPPPPPPLFFSSRKCFTIMSL